MHKGFRPIRFSGEFFWIEFFLKMADFWKMVQLHDDNSCDFGGAAIKDWGE